MPVTDTPSLIGTSAVRLEKHLVQHRAMHRHTAADAVPQPLDVDLG
jgi:hypothetical protein